MRDCSTYKFQLVTFRLGALLLKFESHNKFLDGYSFFRQTSVRMSTEYDHKLIRCPKLGDEITFAYCLQEFGDLPCVRIMQCWFKFFDVEACIKENLIHEKWERFTLTQPKDRVTSLIEIIEIAKRQT